MAFAPSTTQFWFKFCQAMSLLLFLLYTLKQVRVTLWICAADQNQKMKGENSHFWKLQMESRIIQIAKADSVINGVP